MNGQSLLAAPPDESLVWLHGDIKTQLLSRIARMNMKKKERLEAAGWKAGSAKEFLGLTDAEVAVVELKLELAKALKALRTRRKMTQGQAGQLLGSEPIPRGEDRSGRPIGQHRPACASAVQDGC